MSLEAALASVEKALVANTAIMEKVVEGQARNLEAVEKAMAKQVGAAPAKAAAKPAAKPAEPAPKAAEPAQTPKAAEPTPAADQDYTGADGFEAYKAEIVAYLKAVSEAEQAPRKQNIAGIMTHFGLEKPLIGELPEDKRGEAVAFIRALAANPDTPLRDILGAGSDDDGLGI